MEGGGQRSPPPKGEKGSGHGGGSKHRSGSSKKDRPKGGSSGGSHGSGGGSIATGGGFHGSGGGTGSVGGGSSSTGGGFLGSGAGSHAIGGGTAAFGGGTPGGSSRMADWVDSGGKQVGSGGKSQVVIACSQGKVAQVYTKSPAKRLEGARATGAEVAMPGSVVNLLEKIGADAGGDIVRAAWKEASTAAGGSVLGGGLPQDGWCSGIDGGAEMWSPHVEHSAGVLIMAANDVCMQDFTVQGDVQKLDSVMHDSEVNLGCTQGARQNAATTSLGNSQVAGDVSRRTLDHESSKARRDLASHPGGTRWADEVDAVMKDNVETTQGTQGARGYAPTIKEVNFSLNRVGFQPSIVQNLPIGGSQKAGEGGRTPQDYGNSPPKHRANPAGSTGQSAWKKLDPIRVTEVLSRADVSKDGVAVDIIPEDLHNNIAKLERGLVGHLLGRRLPYSFIVEELRRRWGHFGPFQLVSTGADTQRLGRGRPR